MKLFICLMIMFVLTTPLIVACSGNDDSLALSKNEINAETFVYVERLINNDSDSYFSIACENADFDYGKRELTITGLVSVGGGFGWVFKEAFVSGHFVIKLDSDASYNIHINNQYHHLTKIVEGPKTKK